MTCKFCNDTGCTACRMTTADDALRAEVAKLRADLNRAEQHGAIMDAGLAILLAAVPLGEIVTAGANFPDLATSIRRAYAARDGYKHTMTEARADLAAAFAEIEALREEANARAVIIDNLKTQLETTKAVTLEGLEPATIPPEARIPIGYRALVLLEVEWRQSQFDKDAHVPPCWYFPKESTGVKIQSLARAWFKVPPTEMTEAQMGLLRAAGVQTPEASEPEAE